MQPRDDLPQGLGAIEVGVRFDRLWCDGLGHGRPYRSSTAEFLLTESEKAFRIGANRSSDALHP